MAAPVIFSGSRSKLLTSSGLLTSAGRTMDYDGDINYIPNSGFEINSTGYNAYSNTAQSSPVTGTGGSPVVTIARSTSSPLFDTASGLFTKDAANRQGQGFSYDFTIDSAASTSCTPCTISGYYKIASGTYATGDMTIWIYDVTNGVVIQPSASSIANVVGAFPFQCEFQPSNTSTSYRLIFHVSTVSASAYTVQFDNIAVRPNTYNPGSSVSDWQAYTVTITGGGCAKGTTLVDQGWWKRVGDSVLLRYEYNQSAAGTAGSGTYQFSLPPGLTIDTSKLYTGAVNDTQALGTALGFNGTTVYSGSPVYATSTTLMLVMTAGQLGSTNVSLGNTVARIGFDAVVPISGWGSNQVLSSDTDTRVVAACYNSATTATGGAVIKYPTKAVDTHGAYDPSTGVFTVPVAGIYRITAQAYNATAAQRNLQVRKNTVVLSSTYSPTAGSAVMTATATVSCVAGDTLDVSCITTFTPNGTITEVLSIERLCGPAQIAASEKITMDAVKSAGSITANTTIPTWTAVNKDTHGAFNSSTGVYTVPAPGDYFVSGLLSTTSGTPLMGIIKNGAAFRLGQGATQSAGISALLTGLIAGDTISVYSSATLTVTTATAPYQTSISIFRI